jgi:hypothetical protein
MIPAEKFKFIFAVFYAMFNNSLVFFLLFMPWLGGGRFGCAVCPDAPQNNRAKV